MCYSVTAIQDVDYAGNLLLKGMMRNLETTSKRTDGDKIELTVDFTADEVQGYIDAAYKEAGKARIPGFRPGKAPRKVLDNFYGGKDYFLAKATEDLVDSRLALAIDQEGFVPLDKPDLKELDLVEEGKGFAVTTTFLVRPLLELTSYEPVQIELPSEEPTEEEINEQIDVMLQYYVDFEVITDRAIEDKDFVNLAMEMSMDGERVESLCGENMPYELGKGIFPAAFDRELIGMSLDETKEFDFSILPEPEAEEDGAEVEEADDEKSALGMSHVVVTVKNIRVKVRPDLTDEWVKDKLEYESVQAFEDRISDSIRARKAQDVATLRDELSSEELALRLVGEPPQILISQTEQDMYRDFFSSLQKNNQTFEGFLEKGDITAEEFRESIKEQATQITAQTLAYDAMARELALEVSDEEIREEFELSGAEDPDALYAQWKENGRLSEIREGLLRMKAARQVNEGAEVFEPGKKPAPKKAAKKPAAKKTAAEKPADEKAAVEKPEAEKPAEKKVEKGDTDE